MSENVEAQEEDEVAAATLCQNPAGSSRRSGNKPLEKGRWLSPNNEIKLFVVKNRGAGRGRNGATSNRRTVKPFLENQSEPRCQEAKKPHDL